LIAIRENEHIWMSWVISCCFVRVAGALYALLNILWREIPLADTDAGGGWRRRFVGRDGGLGGRRSGGAT
jgi:hypothetical protein